MNNKDQRVAFAGPARQRPHQHALKFEPIPGRIGDSLLGRKHPFRQDRIGIRKAPIAVALCPGVELARVLRRGPR